MATERVDEIGGMVFGGAGCLLLMIALYLPGALWTDRTIDFWLSYAKGTPVDAPFYLAAIISLFEPVFVLNIISELIRLAI